MNHTKIIKQLTLKPKTIFLIDSIGAFVTAFFLFAILRTFNEAIGIPQKVLTYLSLIAVLFSLYSSVCFFLLKDNWRPFLKIISIANLLYCLLTLSLILSYYQSITIIGIAYFSGEIIIIGGLVFIEVKIMKQFA